MPIAIAFKFDQGAQTFIRGLESELDAIKDFRPLWKNITAYLEGNSKINRDKPIEKIWRTEGKTIGGSWGVSPQYEKWKAQNWQNMRIYNVPITQNALQILTGYTLAALLDSNHPGAVREYNAYSMAYGVQNDYSYKQQEQRHILDISRPEMEVGLGNELARYVMDGLKRGGINV